MSNWDKKMIVPRIRFKMFDGEWESPSISGIFELRNGYTPSKFNNSYWVNGTIPWFRMEDIRTNGGILKDAIQHITTSAVKGAGLFQKNSIILATTATIGEHAMVIADSLANQRFTNFSIRKSLKNEYDPLYVYYAFYKIDEWSKKNVNSGGLLAVNIKELLKQPFCAPLILEQKEIAQYFHSLDSLIQATERKIASLKQIKEASLQAMFPAEGETVPKVRFKGFEGEWKNMVIGKAGNTFSGLIGKNKLDFGVGEARYITFLNVLNNAQIDTDILEFVNVSKDEHQNDVQIGDLFFNTSSETPEEVGMCSVLTQDVSNVYLNSFCFGFRISDNNVCPEYLAYLMRGPIGRRIMSVLAQGATRFNLSKNNFLKASIPRPKDFAEQRKIASYFIALDKQISIQKQRLEKLKQIKSACLDAMFV